MQSLKLEIKVFTEFVSKKVEKTWITQAGYQATVKIVPMGHRCGYVTLPDNHPCNGKHYDDLAIQVHGYLTYGEGATFGFDCAHYGDKPDTNLMSESFKEVYEKLGKPDDIVYLDKSDFATIKSLDFCIEQCESMAAQFKAMEVVGQASKG